MDAFGLTWQRIAVGVDLSVLQSFLMPQEQVQEDDITWDMQFELQETRTTPHHTQRCTILSAAPHCTAPHTAPHCASTAMYSAAPGGPAHSCTQLRHTACRSASPHPLPPSYCLHLSLPPSHCPHPTVSRLSLRRCNGSRRRTTVSNLS